MNWFYSELVKLNRDFNIDKALLLLQQIHDAESRGYMMSMAEDRLWMQLTEKIELVKK
jgi:hypothetical protein